LREERKQQQNRHLIIQEKKKRKRGPTLLQLLLVVSKKDNELDSSPMLSRFGSYGKPEQIQNKTKMGTRRNMGLYILYSGWLQQDMR
jgi:hypothetical protein